MTLTLGHFLSLGAMLIGLLAAVALLRGRYLWARYLVAGEIACILAAWAVAQYPYLIIPDVTIASAAAPDSVLLAVTSTNMPSVRVANSEWATSTRMPKSPAPVSQRLL